MTLIDLSRIPDLDTCAGAFGTLTVQPASPEVFDVIVAVVAGAPINHG